jgi:hypothetical protein
MSWPADDSMAHRALLYTDEPEFRTAVGAFIREGLERREQILAAVPAGQLAWLRGELGGDVPAVEFADAASFYRRQGQATRATLDWLPVTPATAGGCRRRRAGLLPPHSLRNTGGLISPH